MKMNDFDSTCQTGQCVHKMCFVEIEITKTNRESSSQLQSVIESNKNARIENDEFIKNNHNSSKLWAKKKLKRQQMSHTS